MLAARLTHSNRILHHVRSAPHVCLAPARFLVTSKATSDKDSKTWGDIGAEVVGVVK
jgi:hypothetical protein